MQVQMVVVHVQSGREWVGEQSEISVEDLEVAKNAIKEHIVKVNYIELAGYILPGDFIRNHCVITFQKA